MNQFNIEKYNNFKFGEIPFNITVTEACNKKNYDIYVRYIQSSILKSADTLNTTYKSYWDCMKLFFKYLYEYEGNPYILDINAINNFTEIWERYSYYCLSNGNSKVTLNKKRTACSTFFDWCIKKKLLFINPFVYIDKLKITDADRRRNSYFLTPQQIWQIKYFLDYGEFVYKENNTKRKLRFDLQDRLIFNLFLDSASRISEVYGLTMQQLDLDNKCFVDVRLKEGYIEPVIFFEETQKIIEEWIKFRKDNNIESDYLLVTKYGNDYKHMNKETIRTRVKKIGLILGIPDFYPHSIRKTIINITGQQDEKLASEFGHHADTRVTRKHYMQKKNAEYLRKELENVRSKACI